MLRPNSPRPPSGTTSTGGAPADTGCAADTLMRHPSRTQRHRCTRVQGNELRQPIDPGGSKRSPFQAAGSACKNGRVSSETIAQLQLTGADEGRAQARPFRPARASRDAASDRCRPPRAPRTGSTPRSTPNGFSALLIVFRRWVNIVRTIRTNSSLVGNRHLRRPKRQPDDGGMHLRLAAETRPGGSDRTRVTSALHRGQDRQDAVVAGADLGDQAIGDLLLQHQHRVAHAVGLRGEIEQREQDRRRDVVGEVADDANLVAGTGRRAEPLGQDRHEIDRQHVARSRR